MKERSTGGPLTRKVHRTVNLNNREELTKLLHGDRRRTFDAQDNSVTEAPMTPAERIGELITDAGEILDECERRKIGFDLHSVPWFAQEIEWRLKRAIRDADEFTAYAVWLAFEAGRLSKEAQIVFDGLDAKTPAQVAWEEASARGLRAASKEATAEKAERNAQIVERAKNEQAKSRSYRKHRIAKDLAAEFKLSVKQIERIIAPLFD